MLEIFVFLIGASCGYIDYYQEALPENYIVACIDDNYYQVAVERWSFLHEYYNVIYVTDYKISEKFLGVAYPNQNFAHAWRYAGTILHEGAHLQCDCNWHEGMEWEEYS